MLFLIGTSIGVFADALFGFDASIADARRRASALARGMLRASAPARRCSWDRNMKSSYMIL
jgi:hypothetical protein